MMASYLPAIYRQLQRLVFDRLPPSLDVKSNSLYDRWRLGPELDRDIEGKRTDGGLFLNAIVVSPLAPIETDADAADTAALWTYPLDIRFLYLRRQDRDLLHVCEAWADPLHDILCRAELHRLGNLIFRDSVGRQVGHVTKYRVVGPPDFYDEAVNNVLAPLDLACFRQQISVELVTVLDPKRRTT